jgi:hypothetical protein
MESIEVIDLSECVETSQHSVSAAQVFQLALVNEHKLETCATDEVYCAVARFDISSTS